MEGCVVTLSFIYWLIMLLTLLFGGYTNRTAIGTPLIWGHSLLLWILLLILGYQVFGSPVR
jgi:predicted membrane protein